MCRIFGSFGPQKVEKTVLDKVSGSMFMGGPDEQVCIVRDKYSLGTNRLAIQGIKNGSQPYSVSNIVAVFNGEIYNYLELIEQFNLDIDNTGAICDGSVIIPLYLKLGKNFVRYLEGMFAIAIIDMRSEPKILIFNDLCGIKTIFYSWNNSKETLYFASEIRGLKHFYNDRIFETEKWALDHFINYRSICEGKTPIKDINILPPRSILECKYGKEPIIEKYESFLQIEDSNLQPTLDKVLIGGVNKIIRSEVPISLVISGGLDSSLVAALVQKKVSKPLQAYHVCYKGDWPFDERKYAQALCNYVGCTYNEVEIDTEEIPQLLLKTINSLSLPNNAPHSISTYALFNKINKDGYKVAITGEGADEFFVGYGRFIEAYRSKDWIDKYLEKFSGVTLDSKYKFFSKDYLNSLEITSNDYLITKFSKFEDCSKLENLLSYDQNQRFPYYILSRVDNLSMANSVEVRLPFCLQTVTQFAQSLSNHKKLGKDARGKAPLYDIAKGKIPSLVFGRKKQPFTLPIFEMFINKCSIYYFIRDTLNSANFKNNQYLSLDIINNFLDSEDYHQEDFKAIWSIVCFFLWENLLNNVEIKV